MDSTQNIGYLLQHLSAVLAKQSDQVLQERLGIGFSQFKILMVLEQDPHVKQKQIADKLGQTEASISRQVSLMHERGLLQTTISPRNRREHITTLTSKGLRLNQAALKALNDFHSPNFESLGEKRQMELLEILRQMHEHACQPGKTGACHHPYNV